MGTKDTQIRTDVQRALAADDELHDSNLSVVVEDGVAELGGHVDSDEQKARAEAIARNVPGVDDVINSLRIGSGQRGAGRWWDAIQGNEFEEAHEKIRKDLDE